MRCEETLSVWFMGVQCKNNVLSVIIYNASFFYFSLTMLLFEALPVIVHNKKFESDHSVLEA